MANYKRGKPKTSPTHSVRGRAANWLRSWPRWWDVIHHRRKPRRAAKELLDAVKSGLRDPDDTAFPDARSKPHNYYW